MDVEVVDGDLLDQDVEVIVNAWNRNVIPWWLLLPQGVSGAIKRRGGHAPFPVIGAGSGGFPEAAALTFLLDALQTSSGTARVRVVRFPAR